MRRQRRLICHGCSSGCRRMRLVCGARSGRAPVPSRLFAPGRLLCLFCQVRMLYVGRVGQSLPHSYTACMSSPSRFDVSSHAERGDFDVGPLAFLPVLQT